MVLKEAEGAAPSVRVVTDVGEVRSPCDIFDPVNVYVRHVFVPFASYFTLVRCYVASVSCTAFSCPESC